MPENVLAILARSTSGDFEPRLTNAVLNLNSIKIDTHQLLWNRSKDSLLIDSDNKSYFNSAAEYGAGIRNLFKLIGFQFYLLKKIFLIRPNLIYSCDLDTLLPSLLYSKLRKVPIIYDQFDPFSSRLQISKINIIIDKMENSLANQCNIRITANKLRNPDSSKKTWIEVKNEFPFQTEETEKFHNFTSIYAGVLQPDRGLEDLLVVFSNYPNSKLLIIGFGPLEAKIIEHAEKFDNIEFLGKMPHTKVISIAAKCDIYFALYNPKKFNNSLTASNKLFEAVSLKVPMITSKGTGLGDIVESNQLGYAVEYGNHNEIIDAIKQIKIMKSTKPEFYESNYRRFSKSNIIDFQFQNVLVEINRILSGSQK